MPGKKLHQSVKTSDALKNRRSGISAGETLGVQSTPTIYINGRKVPCCPPPAVYDALIDIELKKTR